jgi:methyl coenzyme M reductase beta subunit
MGGATDALDMNTYANEVWLKDAAGSSIMNLLLSLSKVSANAQGKVQLITVLQSVINEALRNGAISVGKTLSNEQKLYISELSNDPDAWYQVQNIGYWLNVEIEQVEAEYKAVYILIYSKDDVIRKVEGRHVLI